MLYYTLCFRYENDVGNILYLYPQKHTLIA